ncbi:ABC transporter ATP-binding protein, partial [Halorubrum tibetense]
ALDDVLDAATSDLLAGDATAARDALRREFATPCESDPIEVHQVTPTQEAKCVRYDEGESYAVE